MTDRGANARPFKELNAFGRINLKPGELKTVEFDITLNMLAFYDLHMDYGVKKGAYELMISKSSRDRNLQ